MSAKTNPLLHAGQPKRVRALALLYLVWCSTWCIAYGSANAEVVNPPGAPAPTFLSERALFQRLTQDPLGAYPKQGPHTLLAADCRTLDAAPDDTRRVPLSLTQAVRLALCRNPQMAAAVSQINAQAAALGSAWAAYAPTLSATLGESTNKLNYPDQGFNSDPVTQDTQTVTLNWRLLDFGGRTAGQRAAQAQLVAALASLEASAQKIQGDVISAYFEAQNAQTNLAAQKDLEKLAQRTLETTQRLEARGAAAQTQTLQALAEVAKAQLSASRARAALASSLTELASQLALAQGAPLLLALQAPQAHHGLPADMALQLQAPLGQLYAQAQAQQAEILAAKAQLLGARERVTVSTSEGRPTLDLGVNYFKNGRPNQSLSATKTQETLVGVTLTIPLFDGFASTYKVRRAQSDVERAEAGLLEAEQRVYATIAKAQTEAQSAYESLQFAGDWARAADKAAAATQRKLDLGTGDLTEYLRAQSAAVDAQQQRLRSVADWQGAAQRFLNSIGKPRRAD